MIEIGMHNYLEVFFEYHEGLLDAAAKERVHAFLFKHPELQDEFEAMGDVTIHPSSSLEFPNREALKLTELNEDEHWILALEDSIDNPDSALASKLSSASEKLYFQKHRLVPEQTLLFNEKDQLKAAMSGMPLFMEARLNQWDQDLKLEKEPSISYPDKTALKKAAPFVQFNTIWRSAIAVAAVALIAFLLIPDANQKGNLIPELNTTARLSRDVNYSPEINTTEEATYESVPVINTNSSTSQGKTIENLATNERSESEIPKLIKRAVKSIPLELVADIESPVSNEESAEYGSMDAVAIAQVSVEKSAPEVLTLTEFAKRRLNQTLVNKEDPEEGLLLAVIDRAVEKLDERSERSIEFTVDEKNKTHKGFRLNIGKLEIRK